MKDQINIYYCVEGSSCQVYGGLPLSCDVYLECRERESLLVQWGNHYGGIIYTQKNTHLPISIVINHDGPLGTMIHAFVLCDAMCVFYPKALIK